MRWYYGSYALPENDVDFSFTSPAKLDPSGVPFAYLPRYVLDGRLSIADTGTVAGNQAAMTVAIAELEAAFRVPFQDLIFRDDAGNATPHKLINNETTGGVKVLSAVEYPFSRGAEYTTYRNFRVTLGAEIPDPSAAAGGSGPILRWRESLTYIGTGGRRWVSQEYVEGDPDHQQVAQRTSIRAIQEGSAMGYNAWVPFPPGLYPIEVEHEEMRVYRKDRPTSFVNGVETEWPSSWQYHFEFNDPANGNPTGRPQ